MNTPSELNKSEFHEYTIRVVYEEAKSQSTVVDPHTKSHVINNSDGNGDKLMESKESKDDVTTRRAHKSTEKGLVFKLQTSKKTLATQSKRLQRQIDLVVQLITTPHQVPNIDLVNNEVVVLDKLFTELCDTYSRAGTVMTDEKMDEKSEDYVAFTIAMDEAESKYFGAKSQTCQWLLKQETDLKLREDDRSSKSSKSSKHSSKHSSRSSKQSSHSSRNSSRHSSRRGSDCSGKSDASNLSLKQRAKVEGLKAEAESIVKVNEAELKAKLLRVQQKIAKEEAIDRVYQKELAVSGDEVADDITKSKEEVRVKKVNSGRKATELAASRDKVADDITKMKEVEVKTVKSGRKATDDHVTTTNTDVQLAIMDMMKLQCAPRPDIDTFAGDPLEFFYFKATFKEVIETTVPDQRGRLTRLIKYTSGEAKELIRHLVHADQESCYDQAMSLLDKEYGNAHLVSCSYLRELRNWDVIKQHDSVGYKKFYRFLLKCQAYKAHGRLAELDSTDMLRTMISKVPAHHQDKWNRKASEVRKRKHREAHFSDFVTFFEDETALLNDPAYSRDALLEVKSKSNNTKLACNEKAICHLCSEAHDIEECAKYNNLDVNERHKTVFRLKLCFSCLERVGSDHIAKTCEKKRKCSICSSDHPTSLHGDKVNANLSSLQDQNISMCVVPVILYHKSNPNKQITVYALLDECCTGTFIHDDVLDDLGVQAQDAVISVDTVNGESRRKALSLEGLIVQPTSQHAEHYEKKDITLPRTYSQSHLAVDLEEIPTPSKINPWVYLHRLKERIMNYDPSIPIGLMIGGNCPKANEPLEVILSQADGPYAKRTQLGWCIIGPMSETDSVSTTNCNATRIRIPVKDVPTNQNALHCFTPKNTIHDTSITNILSEMYSNEFNESAGEKRALSVEDEKFLATMKEGAQKINSHHQLPLPFRNISPIMPNNRCQALTRL